MWSDTTLRGYMGITVHWLGRDEFFQLQLYSRLLAIHKVDGRHTGDVMGNVFVRILREAGIHNRVRSATILIETVSHSLIQIGCVTLDNASNCDTMMATVESLLVAEGIAFHRDGNHIRYFISTHSLSLSQLLTSVQVFSARCEYCCPEYVD